MPLPKWRGLRGVGWWGFLFKKYRTAGIIEEEVGTRSTYLWHCRDIYSSFL